MKNFKFENQKNHAFILSFLYELFLIDVGKFLFTEVFHLINKGVTKVEYYHFVIPSELMI